MPYINGPAAVTFNGATWVTTKGVQVDIQEKSIPLNADGFGAVDTVRGGKTATVKFAPANFSAPGALWPYHSAYLGTQLCDKFGSSLTIQTFAGDEASYTFARACVSGMPSLNPSLDNPLVGDVTFTCFPTEAGEFVSAGGGGEPPSVDPDTLIRGPWTCSLGAMQSISSISFAIQTTELSNSTRGPFDLLLTGINVTAAIAPSGMSMSGWLALQGWSAGIGSRATDRSISFSVSAPGFSLTLPKAVPVSANTRFSTTEEIEGPCSLQAVRTLTAGAMDPLWIIA